MRDDRDTYSAQDPFGFKRALKQGHPIRPKHCPSESQRQWARHSPLFGAFRVDAANFYRYIPGKTFVNRMTIYRKSLRTATQHNGDTHLKYWALCSQCSSERDVLGSQDPLSVRLNEASPCSGASRKFQIEEGLQFHRQHGPRGPQQLRNSLLITIGLIRSSISKRKTGLKMAANLNNRRNQEIGKEDYKAVNIER